MKLFTTIQAIHSRGDECKAKQATVHVYTVHYPYVVRIYILEHFTVILQFITMCVQKDAKGSTILHVKTQTYKLEIIKITK